MESYDYVATGIRDYLPNEINYERDLALSSDVLRREYVEINPPQSTVQGISSSSIGNVTEIKLSDPSRWVDTSTLCLTFDVGNIVVPAAPADYTMYANYCVLDGAYAVLSRLNVSVGGVNLSTMNELNKHMNAKYLNGAMTSHLPNDALLLNPGCAKLCPIVQSPTTLPFSPALYATLSNSPANFSMTPAPSAKAGTDVMGFPTSVSGITAAIGTSGYGYENSFQPSSARRTVTIKLGDICPFFTQMRYLPLFLLKDVIFSIYYASPQQAFCTDLFLQITDNSAAGVAQNIISYDVTNIKLVCDLITCSDVLNNRYRMMAASPEGIILPFDDYAVQNATYPHQKSARQLQCNLSTANLKSILFYQQSGTTAKAQNGWCNSNFHYLGINGFQMKVNNNNIPSNPLNRATDIMLYNSRSRGTVGNELSNFVCNNPYIAHAMECAPNATTLASSLPATFVSFFVYSNFEKIINENSEILRNGMNLKDASSTVTIQWNENSDGGAIPTAIRTAVLGADGGSYSAYALMEYQRSLILKNGMIELI